MKKLFLASCVRVTTIIILFTGISFVVPFYIHAETASVWWPVDGSHLSGTQPFKAILEDAAPLESYEMYWKVDTGNLTRMGDSSTDYLHKEIMVDVSGWNWRGAGPYTVTFVAKRNGVVLSEVSKQIYVDGGTTTTAAAQTSPQVATQTTLRVNESQSVPTATTSVSTTPMPVPMPSSNSLYVDSRSNAATQATAWATSRPSDAAAMRVLASAPTAKWFGEWSGDVRDSVKNYVNAASGKVPVLVAYNIPQRDCGGYSAGGTDNYRAWITAFAEGIGSNKALVILEPDALAQFTCISAANQTERLSLLRDAVSILKKNSNTKVYIDAGHAGWIDANLMADRLTRAGLTMADGFSLNVSNFNTTATETEYGNLVSKLVGGTHYVIDTSRNGSGSNGQWCNPSGRAIGTFPTLQTGKSKIDGYLWIKTPGESDGTCNDGPSAGTWWPDYALGLVKGAG